MDVNGNDGHEATKYYSLHDSHDYQNYHISDLYEANDNKCSDVNYDNKLSLFRSFYFLDVCLINKGANKEPKVALIIEIPIIKPHIELLAAVDP